MSELNIARQLLKARHDRKITQEELASYIGVSKAAVSKWESGASFPDITILPQLATYYNMTIDELMGYEPQMTRQEIKRTYSELKERFAREEWSEVLARCEELEKKYFSCFPFLLQLVVLYLNHAPLSPKPETIYRHCIDLAVRIRTEGEDINDAKTATTLEATCYLLLKEPMKALDLCDEKLRPIEQDTEMLGQIYQSIGQLPKAKKAYQVAGYQHLLCLLADATALTLLYAGDFAKAEECIRRTLQLMDAYKVDELHPNTAAGFYITAAQVYCMNQCPKLALDMLEHYTSLCEHDFFPIELHGDAFFDQLDEWFVEFDLGKQAPRSEELIRESMVAAVEQNPMFASLAEQPRYRSVIHRLQKL